MFDNIDTQCLFCSPKGSKRTPVVGHWLSETHLLSVFVCRLINNQFTVDGIKILSAALNVNTALKEIWWGSGVGSQRFQTLSLPAMAPKCYRPTASMYLLFGCVPSVVTMNCIQLSKLSKGFFLHNSRRLLQYSTFSNSNLISSHFKSSLSNVMPKNPPTNRKLNISKRKTSFSASVLLGLVWRLPM